MATIEFAGLGGVEKQSQSVDQGTCEGRDKANLNLVGALGLAFQVANVHRRGWRFTAFSTHLVNEFLPFRMLLERREQHFRGRYERRIPTLSKRCLDGGAGRRLRGITRDLVFTHSDIVISRRHISASTKGHIQANFRVDLPRPILT